MLLKFWVVKGVPLDSIPVLLRGKYPLPWIAIDIMPCHGVIITISMSNFLICVQRKRALGGWRTDFEKMYHLFELGLERSPDANSPSDSSRVYIYIFALGIQLVFEQKSNGRWRMLTSVPDLPLKSMTPPKILSSAQ